ncbi:MAG: DUF4390 domain-containing protein [Nitrospirae bacterium]|jgi:hypothetical protein|nr:DUF4390 domain-containing protein [Nitrospirota bacterium]
MLDFKNICHKVIKRRSAKYLAFQILFVACCLFLSRALSIGAEIKGPEIKLQNNVIYVTTALLLDEKHVQEIKNGIEKEFRFYIGIFRSWGFWPDEFVFGKSYIRTLKCDPVKTEYIATSNDGSRIIEKRFKAFESMVNWVVSIEDLKLMNTQELEPGTYYVRVTVESKIRKLPPVIGYFLIFLPENEFKIKKNSSTFNIGPKK